MPVVVVQQKDKSLQEIPFTPGQSLMEVLRDAGIDEVLALCGGNCACATCHVILTSADFEKLPPMPEDEDDMLEGAADRQPTSRLSCQITLNADLDSLRLSVPGAGSV